MEILFNQRGVREPNYNYQKDKSQADSEVKFDYLLKMNYVSVPILLHYTQKEFISFRIGFAYNRMFNVSEIEWDIRQTYDTVDKFNPNDFSVMADIRLRIWQQLKFGVRFEYSIFSLRTRYFHGDNKFRIAGNRKQRNNTLSFYLVFMLNEKKSDTKKKKEEIEKPYYYSEVLPTYY